MFIPLIVSFLILLVIIITGVQNNTPLELQFIFWKLQLSLAAVIFYSSMLGGGIVAVLALPKLATKYISVKGLSKDVHGLKRRLLEIENEGVKGSGSK